MQNNIKLILSLLIFLSSCKPLEINNSVLETKVPIQSTQTPADKISVYDFVSSADYNEECLRINSSKSKNQANYQDVYPGKTSEDEVQAMLGKPVDIFPSGSEKSWVYSSQSKNLVSIIIIDQTVYRIEIENYEKEPTLEDIVNLYGCPTMIVALDTSEHSSGNYDVAVFSYSENGAEFWFANSGINLTSAPIDIRYFKPLTLNDYIKSLSTILSINSPIMKPVYWTDVVKDK